MKRFIPGGRSQLKLSEGATFHVTEKESLFFAEIEMPACPVASVPERMLFGWSSDRTIVKEGGAKPFPGLAPSG